MDGVRENGKERRDKRGEEETLGRKRESQLKE